MREYPCPRLPRSLGIVEMREEHLRGGCIEPERLEPLPCLGRGSGGVTHAGERIPRMDGMLTKPLLLGHAIARKLE